MLRKWRLSPRNGCRGTTAKPWNGPFPSPIPRRLRMITHPPKTQFCNYAALPKGHAELLPVFRTELERARVGDLLFCPHAGALQYEARDVHTPTFGAKANQPRFSIAGSNIEPLQSFLACCSCWHVATLCMYTRLSTYVQCPIMLRTGQAFRRRRITG